MLGKSDPGEEVKGRGKFADGSIDLDEVRVATRLGACLTHRNSLKIKINYGFKCEIVKNPTKSELISVFQRYNNIKFDSTEQLLMFISSHGSFEPSLQDGYLVQKMDKMHILILVIRVGYPTVNFL